MKIWKTGGEEAIQKFGWDGSYLSEQGAEACDVTIRCYLLGEAISEAVAEIADFWN